MEAKNEAPITPAASPSDPKPTELGHITFDDDGDLLLRVGADLDVELFEFLVCSAALRRASPVWKTMLYGPFKEAKPADGDWVVSLPSDRPDSMSIILDIIHADFGNIPKTPAIEVLHGIMVICDKYDMIEVIRPWAADWLESAMEQESAKDADTLAMVTYIAWQLGDKGLYEAMFNKLAVLCALDQSGSLTLFDGTLLTKYSNLGPSDILDKIALRRTECITKVVKSVHCIIEDLVNQRARHHESLAESESQTCAHITLGSLWLGMIKTRGSILPDGPEEVLESVSELTDSIKKALKFVKGYEGRLGYNTIKCDHTKGIREAIDYGKKDWREVDSAEKAFLEAQSEKTGLSSKGSGLSAELESN
ncbi:hypothetical protein BGZ63DRAFT_424302 [Mariannaea sp. PMI_226]|nr:hypothetical protein BGZ63DRAFT_424302 [Mariannaea sp. PMI_226]